MLFYLMVFILCLSLVVLYGLVAKHPEGGLLLYDREGIQVEDVLTFLLYTAMIAIGVIVIVTMFQVMTSVRKLLGLTSRLQAKHDT